MRRSRMPGGARSGGAGLAVVAGAVALAAALGGCTSQSAAGSSAAPRSPSSAPSSAPPSASTSTSPTATAEPSPSGAGGQGGQGTVEASSYAVKAPGRLLGSLVPADVLIRNPGTIPRSVVRRIRQVPGVTDALPVSVASASVNGRTLSVAVVDPAGFRRFTPPVSARTHAVWDRLAGGEVVLDDRFDRRLVDKGDVLRLGTGDDAPEVHVGAYAPLVQQTTAGGGQRPIFQAAVNVKRGRQLGIEPHNALLVSTGQQVPSTLQRRFEAILDSPATPKATVENRALELENPVQVAVLTDASVSEAVGTFTYRDGPDGTITPDAAWVSAYIRTEQVPILGTVTCNKAVLPQLRGALTEIRLRGLAEEIHPDEYAGCYYPRYIGRDASNGLSLHSWGIALDLNVPGNQRGTVGEMDRGVVSIFKKWGFAWGGDWNYTDPMHFEMNAVVAPG